MVSSGAAVRSARIRVSVSALVAGAMMMAPATLRAQSNDLPSGDPLDPFAIGTTTTQAPAGTAVDQRQVSRAAAANQVSTTDDTGLTNDDLLDDAGSLNQAARRRSLLREQAQLDPRIEQVRPGELRRPAPPSEFESFASVVADKPLRRFGAELLVPTARDFIPPPTIIVPPDYRLNAGDELLIGLTGSVQAADLRLTVNPEGRIFIPRVGAVSVTGVRYADLPAVLRRALSRQYRDFKLSVSVSRLRGITVYVTGFAQTPGSYNISSLSTLVNAVLAAGGPSAGGSFRSIQVRRRDAVVASFDLYDLLLKGDKSADIVLQDGDVIYIAPVGAQAAVIGSVNNEAVFEARPGDTLRDVLGYAGGENTAADDTRALVLDQVNNPAAGWRQVTPAQLATEIVARGQVVRVLSNLGIARPLNQQPVLVTVSGEVARPGRYYLQPGVSLGEVMAQAGGLTPGAYVFGTVLTRQSVRDQQRLSYDQALRDLSLQLTAAPLVRTSRDNPIQPARLDAVRSVVEQLRQRKPDGRIALNLAPYAAALPAGFTMEANDTVYVPPRPTTVGVFGAVPSPGSFEYAGRETLQQVLDRAGGVQKLGDRAAVFVVRANGSVITRRRGGLNRPALPGDLIYVPIASDRGLIWDRIRDLTSILFQSAITAAAVISVTDDH